jgi:glycosyltransferase involved in cell wall biosynthesis
VEDSPATAAAVLELLEHDELRRRMGDAAHARARCEQTWAQRAGQYDQLLRGLAASHDRTRREQKAIA